MTTCMASRKVWSAMTLGILLLGLAACGGNDSTAPGGNLGGSSRPPEMVGDISTPPLPEDFPQQQPVTGSFASAPLGTNPLYDVQEAEELVQTYSFTHSESAARGASQDPSIPFEVLWVAIAPHGTPFDEVVAGRADPQVLPEGTVVDLYIAFTVTENQVSFYREWAIDNAGLRYIEPHPDTRNIGDYYSVMPFILPYGTSDLDTTFVGALSMAGESVLPIDRGTSVLLPEGFSHYRWLDFYMSDVELEPGINYPGTGDYDGNSDDPSNSIPDEIIVDFNDTSVDVTCDMGISHIVLEFQDGTREKIDDLSKEEDLLFGTFEGSGENEGKTIVTVWVKAGSNASGDGPNSGYGERFDLFELYDRLSMAQICLEDPYIGADYDYNEFVCGYRVTEFRNASNELVQLVITVKASARSFIAADWQFNVDAAFPNSGVQYFVDQYYADGTPHGPQRYYWSDDGISVPIFTSIREALIPPDGAPFPNCVGGQQYEYCYGDWVEVTVTLDTPCPYGTYTMLPYKPYLILQPSLGEDPYPIFVWTKPGDPLDSGYGSNGRPWAFIVPDTYAWPLNGNSIWTCYGGFDTWINWINGGPEPKTKWYNEIPVHELVFTRDKFLPWPIPEPAP